MTFLMNWFNSVEQIERLQAECQLKTEQVLHWMRVAGRMCTQGLGSLNAHAHLCHEAALSWWHDKEGKFVPRNHGECFALMHSEISEAMEGARKDKMDDHLPHRKSVEVELADALIRIFDYAGAHGLDLDGAVAEKMAYNRTRLDHTAAARAAAGGKKW